MRKIFTLKIWLTIEEAIEHLSQIFDEKLTKKDIYTFVKEYNLTLSFLCIGEVKAKPALIYTEPIFGELPDGTTYHQSEYVKENCYLIPDWSKEFSYIPIEGIIDLVPIGCGSTIIEKYLMENDDFIFLDKVYIRTTQEEYFWHVDSLEVQPQLITEGLLKGTRTRKIHIPIGELPENIQLGIKTTELNLLLSKLSQKNNSTPELKTQQPISNESIYLLIAALFEQLKRHAPRINQSQVTADIAEAYKNIKGLSASQTTKIIAEANRKIKDIKNKR